MNHNCPFCLNRRPTSTANPLQWILVESRLLGSVGNIVLCAGLGAIVEPYVIAFTREHILSTAELPSSGRRDLLAALDVCLRSRLFSSGSLCVFEHGGRSAETVTGCLEHCHIHVVDGQFDLRTELVSEYADAKEARLSETDQLSADGGYLFTGIYQGDGRLGGLLVEAPGCGSQFFRRLLATKVRTLDWNWRLAPKPQAAARLCSQWSYIP